MEPCTDVGCPSQRQASLSKKKRNSKHPSSSESLKTERNKVWSVLQEAEPQRHQGESDTLTWQCWHGIAEYWEALCWIQAAPNGCCSAPPVQLLLCKIYLFDFICSRSLLYISRTGKRNKKKPTEVLRQKHRAKRRAFKSTAEQIKSNLGSSPGRHSVSLSTVAEMFLCCNRHCFSSSIAIISFRKGKKKSHWEQQADRERI